MIPTHRFEVFHNGKEKRPEKEILKLSELYQNPTDESIPDTLIADIESEKDLVLMSIVAILKNFIKILALCLLEKQV